MGKQPGKIVYLDGIRGCASLMVFFHHFLLSFYSAYYTFDIGSLHLHGMEVLFGKSVFSVFASGRFAVIIFFVLSGYVLSRKYFQSNNFDLLNSGAQRRFVRLYVPVAFTLIVAYGLMKSSLLYNVPVGLISHSEWWLCNLWSCPAPFAKLCHCLAVGTMFEGDATLDTSMWTMSVELYGSLLVFAFLALTHHTRNRKAMLLVVFLFFVFSNQPKYSAFIMGMSLNYVETGYLRINKYFITLLAAVLLLSGLMLGSYPATFEFKNTIFEHMPEGIRTYFEWLVTSGAYFVVLAFVISPRLQQFMSLRFFRFCGYVSFSFYLLHPLLIGSFSCYIFLRLYGQWGYNHTAAAVFIATLVVGFGLSWLMTRFVDERGIRLSKYLYARWGVKSMNCE